MVQRGDLSAKYPEGILCGCADGGDLYGAGGIDEVVVRLVVGICRSLHVAVRQRCLVGVFSEGRVAAGQPLGDIHISLSGSFQLLSANHRNSDIRLGRERHGACDVERTALHAAAVLRVDSHRAPHDRNVVVAHQSRCLVFTGDGNRHPFAVYFRS